MISAILGKHVASDVSEREGGGVVVAAARWSLQGRGPLNPQQEPDLSDG